MTELLAAIPQPPVNDEVPKTAEVVFTIFLVLPLVAALVFAVRNVMVGKGPLLLYCVIGGAIAMTYEPIVDVLGQVYLKEEGAIGTVTILDRTMPLYIFWVYAWYVGGLGYIAYRLFDAGIGARALFALWGLDFVINIFLETPGIVAGVYLYYGDQPFDIWGFPLWWGFVNPLMPMIAGALIYKLRPYLTGWRLAAVIPIIPMADGVANGAAGWPMFIALNQNDPSYVWTYLAGFATLGLSLFTVWIVSLVVARPEAEIADQTLFERLKALLVGPGAEPPPTDRAAPRAPEAVPS